MNTFMAKLQKQWDDGKFVCLGLDPDLSKIPDEHLPGTPSTAEAVMIAFLQEIVDATKDVVAAYKPNSSFFERYSWRGMRALETICDYIREVAPDVPIIGDGKRGDIGNSNQGSVVFFFDELGVDAVTVSPYLGREALQPFLDRTDKGVFVLCRTSNPGAGEFQDLASSHHSEERNRLYQVVAENVARQWNANGNCGVVAGATYPGQLAVIREIVGDDVTILIPGAGSQGGEVEATVVAGMNSWGDGMVVNSSRQILYASGGSDFAEAARIEAVKLNNEINHYRQVALAKR